MQVSGKQKLPSANLPGVTPSSRCSDVTNTTTDPICLACGASDSGVFWKDHNRTVWRCKSCGLLFVFPQPKQTTLHTQFQADYFTRGQSSDPIRLKLDFEEWRKPAFTQIAQRVHALKSAGKLLDVGCASGEIFEYFRAGEWDLYGVEPSEVAFARAHQRFGRDSRIHLFNGYLSDASFEDKSFDVITVLESIYYMPNPQHELSHLTRILKGDGLLAIAVPGFTYQRLRHIGLISYLLNGKRCSLTTSHLFHFSNKSMAKLLQTQGLRIRDILQLGSSAHGSRTGRVARNIYLGLTATLGALTLGRINLAPHVLYLCEKAKKH